MTFKMGHVTCEDGCFFVVILVVLVVVHVVVIVVVNVVLSFLQLYLMTLIFLIKYGVLPFVFCYMYVQYKLIWTYLSAKM